MSIFAFGQPDGAIFQMAYNVADIESVMDDFTARLNVGPWFVMGPFSPPGARYLGAPCAFSVTLAFAFVGSVQIELLQQHNDAPSALRDHPFGFHHWGVGVRDYDAARTAHEAKGGEVVFTDQAPDGGRFAYVDTSARLPGLIELIEMTSEREAMFAMMHKEAMAWDRTNPVRRMGP